MIRFSCPTCSTLLQAPDDQVGTKVLCAKCRQKLQVPRPAALLPTAKTVLGKLEDFPLPTAKRPPPLPIKSLSVPPLPINAAVDAVYCRRCGKQAYAPVLCLYCSAVCCSEVCVGKHVEHCSSVPEPSVEVIRTPNEVAVGCPGCGRQLKIESRLLAAPIQCAVCNTVFEPSTGRMVSQPQSPPQNTFVHVIRDESSARRRDEGNPGFGVAALVLGIVSLPLCIFPCFFAGFPALICGILAVIFGVVGLNRRAGRGMAGAGFILGLTTVTLWSLVALSLLSAVTYRL